MQHPEIDEIGLVAQSASGSKDTSRPHVAESGHAHFDSAHAMTSSPLSPAILATPHEVPINAVKPSPSTTPSSLATHRSGRHDAIPDLNMPQDFDDLLSGLRADDLDDYADLEEFGLEEQVKQGFNEEHALRGRIETREALPHDISSPSNAFDAVDGTILPPGLVGFQTGAGRLIAPPSSAALAKVRKIFDEPEDPDEIRTESPPYIAPGGPGPSTLANKRRRILEERNGGSAFAKVSAAPVSPPLLEADRQVKDLFCEEHDVSIQSHRAAPIQSTSLFATAAGSAAPPIDSQSAVAVSRLFSDAGGDVDHTCASTAPKQQSGFTTASGRKTAMPSKLAMARAMAIFGEVDESDALFQDPSSNIIASQNFLPDESQIFATLFNNPPLRPRSPAPFLPPNTLSLNDLATPSRLPLRTTTNVVPPPGRTLVTPQSKEVKNTAKRTPSFSRRLGLAGAPASRGKPKKSFVTPFKPPGALATSLGPSSPMPRGMTASHSMVISAPKRDIIFRDVFDVSCSEERRNLRDAFVKPQFHSIAELGELGLPNEVWTLGLHNAIYYQFIVEDASTFDHRSAYDLLLRHGCSLLTEKWVDNHWRLILWKLAGEICAAPRLFDRKWTWNEVVSQLKYRYQREYGIPQRPIIRRIQEHDTAAGIPMVLCVSDVFRPSNHLNVAMESVPVRPCLELTDGWYRINVEIDDCLARAVDRGRICIGRKVAVIGAKLDSGSEGADVLEAKDKTHLTISGNSSALARWDCRLGASPRPFIAGLTSLSVDGGLIALVDIIVEKVFPLAFMSSDKGVRDSPWNEAEEQLRQDRWHDKRAGESLRLQDMMRMRLEKTEDFASNLASHAEDLDHVSGNKSPPSNLESLFDNLLNARDVMARLRTMEPYTLVHLAHYARSRMEQEMLDTEAEMEAELNIACPPRLVRDFRMVRIRDAREGRKETTRLAMMNVWDAKSCAPEDLREGQRCLITNLMPGRNGDWNLPRSRLEKPEIYLNTRRDTRWTVANNET